MPEEKKNLKVNCALVDATRVSEETLAAYESIKLNCAVVLQSEKSRALMSRYQVKMNCAKVLLTPEGCRASVVNGSKTLTAADKAESPTLLLVNGGLRVLPDAGEALRSYTALVVNGELLCPDSLRADAGEVTVNGATRFYPHDAILLDRALDVDTFFILQAKENARYYVTGKVCAIEEGLPLKTLCEKGVRIQTKRAVVRAGYLADAAQILEGIEGNVELMCIPDGCAYVRESAPLDSLIVRYGKSLYLDCGLALQEQDAEALASLDYLEVHGDVTLPRALEGPFCQKCRKFKKLNVLTEEDEASIRDIPEVIITRQLLEDSQRGLSIRDCDQVRVDPDIPAELLRRIKTLRDCGRIFCTREQQTVLQLICRDIAGFSDSSKPEVEEPDPEEKRTVKINCTSYTL